MLTDLEKKSIAKVLLEIMNADRRVTFGESEAMRDMQNNLHIFPSQVEEAKTMNPYTCLNVISRMNIQNKAIVAVAIHRMINADGNASPEEIEIFNLVCYHCGINL